MNRLNTLRPGERAAVVQVLPFAAARRLGELGLRTGAEIRCTGRSPLGDPSAYLIAGAVVALRSADAANIIISRN